MAMVDCESSDRPRAHGPPCTASAVTLHEAFVRGRLTAVATARAALLRQASTDSWLRAFTDITASAALEIATDLDSRRRAGAPLGPLAGVPIAVKGRRGTAGFQDRRLRDAAAIPIGLTATPRGPGPQTWGYTDRGPTRNPWRPELSPGGSSAGSAAAVAAGVVPLATGSDGAGSTRIPAAWCGIYGYKPTTALSPVADRAGLTVAAPLARDPRDLTVWADVVLGPLPHPDPARTAAWSPDLGYAGTELDDEVVEIACAAAGRLVARTGLAWADRPLALRDPATAWTTLRDPHPSPAAVRAAERLRAVNAHRLAALFAGVDLLLTPTTPGPPHDHSGPGERMSVALTWAFNLSGHPAISVPAGHTRSGAPVGLQIIARHRADRALLELACTQSAAPIAPAGSPCPRHQP